MRQDDWGVDIVVSSSQKALMCPPGLGLVSISAKAWMVINRERGMPRHCRLSAALRVGCAALGLPSFSQADALSSTVVALEVPEKLNGGDIVRRMYERHGTVIAGSRNKLAGKVIRIGTMGHIHAGGVTAAAAALEEHS
jgi:aspartate aminotransferase-like enzyme